MRQFFEIVLCVVCAGVIAFVLFLVIAKPSAAATVLGPEDTGSSITLADLITTDDLGYSCLAEDDLEAAWRADGKKPSLLPQTCMPAPCAQEPLSQVEFEHFIIGTRVEQRTYVEYRKRMANHCGTPTFWEERGITEERLLWSIGCHETANLSCSIPRQDPPSVPLPASALLLGAALLGLGFVRRAG